jgi:hypothetical protein
MNLRFIKLAAFVQQHTQGEPEGGYVSLAIGVEAVGIHRLVGCCSG